jgi:hypothetical protein
MSLARVLNPRGRPAPDLGLSELDETSAMVYLGDVYSVLLLAAIADRAALAEPTALAPVPADSVWPFIR